jgi:hypothetical protein
MCSKRYTHEAALAKEGQNKFTINRGLGDRSMPKSLMRKDPQRPGPKWLGEGLNGGNGHYDQGYDVALS